MKMNTVAGFNKYNNCKYAPNFHEIPLFTIKSKSRPFQN